MGFAHLCGEKKQTRRSVGLAAFNFRQSKLVRYSGAFTVDAIKSFLADVAADKLKVINLPKVCIAMSP